MGQTVSFVGYRPAPRYDAEPWTTALIEEATASSGPWTQIDAITLSPVDADPTNPASRSFTTENGTAPGLWYRVLFEDADLDLSSPTAAIKNSAGSATVFTTPTEVFRVLKLRTPTADQTTAMEQYISEAAGEICAEIDLADGVELTDWQLDLCARVNVDRAADLWRHTESAPGILGVVDETVPTSYGRYSWERYAQRLSPIKSQWGIA